MIIPRSRDELARWIAAHGMIHLHYRRHPTAQGWVVVAQHNPMKCGTSECLRVAAARKAAV